MQEEWRRKIPEISRQFCGLSVFKIETLHLVGNLMAGFVKRHLAIHPHAAVEAFQSGMQLGKRTVGTKAIPDTQSGVAKLILKRRVDVNCLTTTQGDGCRIVGVIDGGLQLLR
jgi:hypothetical protein